MSKSLVKAKIINSLLFRVWNYWKDGKRSHVFVVPVTGGTAKDLMQGDDYDCPPVDLGASTIDYVFSPDGKEVCITMNTDPMVAISTNNDLFILPVTGGEKKRITTNKANDNQPVYSPDGKYIAYRAMARPMFEADQYDLMLYDRKTGTAVNITEKFDRSIGEVIWSSDSKNLYFIAEDMGYEPTYQISLKTGKKGELIGEEPKKVFDKSFNSKIKITPDGKTLLFLREKTNMPREVFSFDLTAKDVTKSLKQISNVNTVKIAELEMNSLEEFWFEGAGGTKVHGFILKPPKFDATKKYPMLYLIHGGPQGAWGDDFHYRWNLQMFASPGYVVVAVNPRGSTGYGQQFTDEITGDWGGKVYEDLMKGVDYVLANYNFIDKDKLAAAGASYGGYMINWIAGHTDRFKCLVSHAGVYDLNTDYLATEELWFAEWEFKGTPWENPELYKKMAPSTYAGNFGKFRTPTLVIHGELDFRVPVTEGIQMFTALQRQGVPSKLIYFPDEGHHILKPQNSELWYNSVLDWFKQWLK
jgi:dipeptidyl aminopeptidase/acylaminoacyl peptidase